MTVPANWYADPYDASRLRWWDGAQWTEATHALAPVPQQIVPQQMVPQQAVPQQAVYQPAGYAQPTYAQHGAALTSANPSACQACGAQPAREAKFNTLRGLLVLARFGTVQGRWCRDCAEAVFRDCQNLTLTWGWWSVLAFFFTPVGLLLNLVERRKCQALAPASQRPGHPLAPGEPLFRRPGVYIGLAVLLAACLFFVTR